MTSLEFLNIDCERYVDSFAYCSSLFVYLNVFSIVTWHRYKMSHAILHVTIWLCQKEICSATFAKNITAYADVGKKITYTVFNLSLSSSNTSSVYVCICVYTYVYACVRACIALRVYLCWWLYVSTTTNDVGYSITIRNVYTTIPRCPSIRIILSVFASHVP